MAELVTIRKGQIDAPIIHKNMIPMIMVIADMAGPLDSPLYGMFEMAADIDSEGGLGFNQHYFSQPDGLDAISVLWDGEWKITYETFRDMGLAYGVGMIAIYLLVVAHFRSYLVPLIIMALSLDHYRGHAGTRLARRPVHRHLHDRHDSAGGDHSA